MERFGRYRMTGTLGAGAMGEVFAATDDVLGRAVAVKVLKGHRNALAARMLDDRFRMEARAIAALSHPSVVAVFDIDLDADPPYLVMERVQGPSLKDRLAAGPLPVHEARALGIQIARALAAAHAQRIVHRDVKPANILAAGDGAWKLADFGVAHIPDSSLTMTGQFMGSPAYAPPEALIRGQSDAEADVYGLGATLYQALAGRWPRMDAPPSGALIPPVPPLRELAPSVPADVAAAIDRAVALDPGARGTAADLADALAGATTARTETGSDPFTGQDRTRRWLPWAIGGAVVLLTIVLVAATRGGGGASMGAAAPAPADGGRRPDDRRPDDHRPGDDEDDDHRVPEAMPEHDRRKVLDQLDKGHYREARDKLDEWIDHNGNNADTDTLRQQIDQAETADPDPRPPGPPRPDGPGPRGKGKKHRD